MTLWEMSACMEGYRLSQGGEKEVAAPSYEDHLAMVARLG